MAHIGELIEQANERVGGTLIDALIRAQRNITHAYAQGKNDHFKSTYATLQNVVDAVKPALLAEGVLFQQVVHQAEHGADVETLFYGYGDVLSAGRVFVPADRQNAHGFGSALTYARRYGLALACGIADQEDDDGNKAVETNRSDVRGAVLDGIQMNKAQIAKRDEYVASLREAMPETAVYYEGRKRMFREEQLDKSTILELREELNEDHEMYIAVIDELETWQRNFMRNKAKEG